MIRNNRLKYSMSYSPLSWAICSLVSFLLWYAYDFARLCYLQNFFFSACNYCCWFFLFLSSICLSPTYSNLQFSPFTFGYLMPLLISYFVWLDNVMDDYLCYDCGCAKEYWLSSHLCGFFLATGMKDIHVFVSAGPVPCGRH